MKEREINLIDLLAEILLHWRMMLLCMLIGGIALGLVSYRNSRSAEKPVDPAPPEEALSEQEMQNVSWLTAYEKAYRAAETYLEKSALMKMDPSRVSTAEATIAIEAAGGQKSCDDIAEAYGDIVQSGEFMERAAKDAGVEMYGIDRMILLDSNNGNFGRIIMDGGVGKSTFRIIAKHAGEEGSRKMLASAVAFLREKKPGIEEALGQHELSVANESFAAVADSSIADIQKNLLNEAASMKERFLSGKAALSDAEGQYYAFLNKEAEQEGGEETAAAPAVNAKYILLGAALAVFLYAFLVFLAYILNTKIRAEDSLQELYGIPQLGMVPAGKDGGKRLNFVDRWILSFRDRNKRQFAPEEALGLAAAAVKISAGKAGLREICLVGCGLKEGSLETSGKIKGRLEKDGLRVKILDNVLYDARMMEELEGAEGAVLVESAGITLYNEIAEELELLRRQGITVLGGILLE